MKKLIFTLSAVCILVFAFAQSDSARYDVLETCLGGKGIKIGIRGGLFDGKYISCPDGYEDACIYIMIDLEDALKNSPLVAGGKLVHPDRLSGSDLKPFLSYQKQKLEKARNGETHHFFYATNISTPTNTRVTDPCSWSTEDASGVEMEFWGTDSSNLGSSSTVKKGELNYVLIDYSKRILIKHNTAQ